MVETQWPTGWRTAETLTVETDQLLYRVLNADGDRQVTDFNPGFGAPTRFVFFPDDSGALVPVLYAAYSAEAAISETLFRDIPATGGILVAADYTRAMLAALRTRRPLKLAKFMGTGLRAPWHDPSSTNVVGHANVSRNCAVGTGSTPCRI